MCVQSLQIIIFENQENIAQKPDRSKQIKKVDGKIQVEIDTLLENRFPADYSLTLINEIKGLGAIRYIIKIHCQKMRC